MYEDILKDLLAMLEEKTGINDMNPGAIARTLIEVLSEKYADIYMEIKNVSITSFVSTAIGQYLDLIGELLDCKRETDEDDERYRSRIVKQVYVVAGANRTAIRLSALSVEGVKDVVFREYTHGGGSFTIHVLTDDLERTNEILAAVEAKVNEVKAAGVYAEVTTPLLIPVSLKVRVIYRSNVTTNEKEVIKAHLVKDVKNYMGKLNPGDMLMYYDLVKVLKNTSPKISDLVIQSITVKDVPRFVGNVPARWDERLYLQSINVE